VDYVVCAVTDFCQVGTRYPDFRSETSEFIQLPNLSKGKKIMVKSDIRIEGKGVMSSDYQSVHFGVSMTLKDIDAEQAADYMDMLQAQVSDRLQLMKSDSRILLANLLEGE